MDTPKISEIAVPTSLDTFLEQAKVLNKEFIKKPKKTIERMFEYIGEKYGREAVIVFAEHNQEKNNVSMPAGKIDWQVYFIQTVEMKLVSLDDAVNICRKVRNNKRERQFNGYMPKYQ